MKKICFFNFTLIWLFLKCANISETPENPMHNNQESSQSNTGSSSNTYMSHFLADVVEEAPGHLGSGFCDKNKAINGVRGEGTGAGSLDVFSLDNPGANTCGGSSTHIILKWSNKKVKNGPGADFIIYENPFYVGGDPSNRFMDLLVVEVSLDKVNWCGFNPDYTYTPESTYIRNPQYWQRFAGKAPVLYNVDIPSQNFTLNELFQDNNNDKEGDMGGGDLFDLEDLSEDNYWATGCNAALRDQLKQGFIYLRLTPATRRINRDTGSNFVKDIMSNGPDIDGVLARYFENI